jgi:His-Xaa-Ser system protein HxsD
MGHWSSTGADEVGRYATVEIDRRIYSDAAIFKTAYWFCDRYYLFLDAKDADSNRMLVEMRPKAAEDAEGLPEALAEFCNSLVDHRVRDQVIQETAPIREALVTKAFLEGAKR